jgi:hypothetical protein
MTEYIPDVATIGGIAGLFIRMYFENKKQKKDSKVLLESVHGTQNEVVKIGMEMKELKTDLLFKTKFHNLVQNQANHYAAAFGLAGEHYCKSVYYWCELIEKFGTDYYYSDFRKNAIGKKTQLKKYVDDFMKRNEDQFIYYLEKVFQEPRYNGKNQKFFFAQNIEQSKCFIAVNEILIMDMIQNGFDSDTFQIRIQDYLMAFFDEFVNEAKKFLELKELTEVDI